MRLPGGLTVRGLGLLLGVGVLWATGRLLGVDGLFAIAIACGVLVVCAIVVVRVSARSLSVQRHLTSTRVPFGAPAECQIQFTNTSRLPSGTLYVADQVHWSLAEPPQMIVASLRPRKRAAVSYPLRGTQRGRHQVGPLTVHVSDPFGLCQVKRSFDSTDQIVVYPRIEQLGSPPVGGNHRGSGTSSQRRLFNAGDEFHTLREYIQGDDLRMVNWSATAKWEKIMVRQHEQPWDAEATVFVDTRARAHHAAQGDATLEKALSVAASVVMQLARNGYRIRLFTDDDRHPRDFEPPLAHLDRLAELQPSGQAHLTGGMRTLMKSGSEGLLVAVLPAPLGSAGAQGDRQTSALKSAGRHHATRQAISIHSPLAHHAANAHAAMAALGAMDWTTATVATDEPFAAVWQKLHASRRPRTPQTVIATPGGGR